MELAGQTCMPTSYDSHDFKNAPTVAQEFHFLKGIGGGREVTL